MHTRRIEWLPEFSGWWIADEWSGGTSWRKNCAVDEHKWRRKLLEHGVSRRVFRLIGALFAKLMGGDAVYYGIAVNCWKTECQRVLGMLLATKTFVACLEHFGSSRCCSQVVDDRLVRLCALLAAL